MTAASLTAAGVALVSTTLGTIYQKRHGARMPLLSGTALQYVAAGLAMVPLALIFEARAMTWAPQLIFALAWLVLVLSIGAILLLMRFWRGWQRGRTIRRSSPQCVPFLPSHREHYIAMRLSGLAVPSRELKGITL